MIGAYLLCEYISKVSSQAGPYFWHAYVSIMANHNAYRFGSIISSYQDFWFGDIPLVTIIIFTCMNIVFVAFYILFKLLLVLLDEFIVEYFILNK